MPGSITMPSGWLIPFLTSFAAAAVRSGVTRFAAPIWSSAPQGEGTHSSADTAEVATINASERLVLARLTMKLMMIPFIVVSRFVYRRDRQSDHQKW